MSLIGRMTHVISAIRSWVGVRGTGYYESFNFKLRDELLVREFFYDLREAKALTEALATALQHGTAALIARQRTTCTKSRLVRGVHGSLL